MTASLISVILPVYNGARFIGKALDCIASQRRHCEDHGFEVIAVDDASDDGNLSASLLAAALAARRIDHLVSLPENRGPAAARNEGLRLARGNLITFLDVDDYWPPEHLARLLRELRASPDSGFVLSDVQCQVRAGPAAGGVGPFEDFGKPGFLPVFSAGLYRREVFARVGLLDEQMRHGEDLDWFLRAREEGVRYVTTRETLLRYRVHETNISRNRKAAYQGMVRALHQSMRRRSANPAMPECSRIMTGETLPTVSVILPVKNGARYLAAALESVVAQTHPPLEVLVLDDQSKDSTSEIAKRFAPYGIRFVADPGCAGAAALRNLGVTLARGELVAFHAYDDLWEPEKLRIQARFLRDRPEILFCITHVRCFVDPGQEPPRGLARDRIGVAVPGYLPETLLARRAAFERVGFFDTTMQQGEDTDWYARAQDYGVPMAVLPDCLVHKRLHATTTTYGSGRTDLLQRQLVRVARRTLERKRAPATRPPARETDAPPG